MDPLITIRGRRLAAESKRQNSPPCSHPSVSLLTLSAAQIAPQGPRQGRSSLPAWSTSPSRGGAAPAQVSRAAAESGLARLQPRAVPRCPPRWSRPAEPPHGAPARERLDFQPMSKFSWGRQTATGTTSGVLTTLPVTEPRRQDPPPAPSGPRLLQPARPRC